MTNRKVRPLTDEEKDLVAQHGLSDEQIAWRRTRWQVMRGVAAQEYAEDSVSCFLASGECVFDMEAIDRAAAQAGKAVESQDNGRLIAWPPPQAQKQYIVGVDAAGGGTDGDYACAQVIERRMGCSAPNCMDIFLRMTWPSKLVALGRGITTHSLRWNGIIMDTACWRT